MAVKTVIFKEMELMKEGFTKTGKPWQKYQYYADDGEHYTLFGKYELEKPYNLVQKTREYQGKTYTDWIVVNEQKSGAGVKAIMDKMDGLLAEIQDVKRIVTGLAQKAEDMPVVGVDPELPF